MSLQKVMRKVWLSAGVFLPVTLFSQNVVKLDVNLIEVENCTQPIQHISSNQIIKLGNQKISSPALLNLTTITQKVLPSFKDVELDKSLQVVANDISDLSFSGNDLLMRTGNSWNKVDQFNSQLFGKIKHIAKNTSSSVFVFTESTVVLFDFIQLSVIKSINIPESITNGKIISNDGIIVITSKDQSYSFDRTFLKFSKFSKTRIEDISMVSPHKMVMVEKKSNQKTFDISIKNISDSGLGSETRIGTPYKTKPLLTASNGQVWVAINNRLEVLNLSGSRNDLCLQFVNEIKSIQNNDGLIELIFSDGGKVGIQTSSDNSMFSYLNFDDTQKGADFKSNYYINLDYCYIVRSGKHHSGFIRKTAVDFDKFDVVKPFVPHSKDFFSYLKSSWSPALGAVYDGSGIASFNLSAHCFSLEPLIYPQIQPFNLKTNSPLGAYHVSC